MNGRGRVSGEVATAQRRRLATAVATGDRTGRRWATPASPRPGTWAERSPRCPQVLAWAVRPATGETSHGRLSASRPYGGRYRDSASLQLRVMGRGSMLSTSDP